MNNGLSTIKKHHAKGTVLLVTFDLYCHWGIADGVGGVISASKRKGKVVHESEAEFSDNRKIVVNKRYTPSVAAYKRIETRLGAPYNLLECNCEHYVNWAFDLKPESKQVEVALATTGAAIVLGVSKTWQGAALGVFLVFLLAKTSSNITEQ